MSRHLIVTGALNAPSASPEALQRRRIVARVGVSVSLAGVMASIAFGPDRRGDVVALAGLTAARIGGECCR